MRFPVSTRAYLGIPMPAITSEAALLRMCQSMSLVSVALPEATSGGRVALGETLTVARRSTSSGPGVGTTVWSVSAIGVNLVRVRVRFRVRVRVRVALLHRYFSNLSKEVFQ